MADNVDFILKNANYTEDLKELVKDQYKNSPNVDKILNVVSSVMQDYENILVEAAEGMLFDRAIGEQLDEIGRQSNISRRVEGDDQYRAIISLKAFELTNTGSRDKLYEILAKYSAESVQFVLGLDGQVDVNMFASCIYDLQGAEGITKLLPINTYYRVVHTDGTPFGFDADSAGYGSTADLQAGGNMSGWLASVQD